jgi:acyl carrier protein
MQTASKPKLTRERIHELLWTVVAKEAEKDREEIRPEHRVYQDLGIDSLSAVQIHMELEEGLETTIPDDLLNNQEVTMAQLDAGLCGHLLP